MLVFQAQNGARRLPLRLLAEHLGVVRHFLHLALDSTFGGMKDGQQQFPRAHMGVLEKSHEDHQTRHVVCIHRTVPKRANRFQASFPPPPFQF